ncbi:peptidoglycan-binding protein [Mesorhizobium sp. KR9-304]|uniref:peptidoglycan-binding protein n=1 Tax=Mesorhizobium sp. KR9-304 TaxID=3156614 RepID=UPI0032B3B05F
MGGLVVAAALSLLLPLPLHAAEDNAVVAESLRAMFQSGTADTGSEAANAALPSVREIYEIRDFKPIWVRDNGPKTKARALLAELKISGVHGLSPEFYHVAEIEALMQSSEPDDLARLDMLLSGAAVEFGGDLANGRIGPDLAPSENAVAPLATTPAEYVAGAEAAENLRDFAGALLNEDFRYVRLISKLNEFTRLQASGQWPAIDAAGAPIASGAGDPRMKDIRRLLALSGDLPISLMGGGDLHDDKTIDAVRGFQTRHGLDPTGAIDAATLAEMAVPIGDRIRQIKVNLERRRWQNRGLGDENIYINLADSNVKIVHGGRSDRFVAVANAAELGALPTFFGSVTGVEVRPGDVPEIALTVQSPFIDRIGGRGSEREIAITDAVSVASDLIAVRALPGETIDTLLASDTPARIEFGEPLPLFVTFVTAWANGDGSVHFRRDPTGRDAKVAALLQLD